MMKVNYIQKKQKKDMSQYYFLFYIQYEFM